MKYLLTISFLLITLFGFGQQVNAPDPKTFTINTSGQDGSGFSLSGFNSTDILLCAIGLPQAPAGTTFYLTTTSGLTPATGYSLTGNKSRLAFTGTQANINAALATLKINTTATAGSVQISISATVNPTGYFYNPTNGHFYRPISSGAPYHTAKTLSSQQTFKGQQGYLVTLTSSDEENFVILNVPQTNIWIALTDEVVEGQWRIDAGPEAGTLIKTSNGQTAGNIQGQYNNWCGGEPNNSNNEDYAVTKWSGGSCWNDLPTGPSWNNPYIVEFGTWSNPDDQSFSDFYSNSTIHSNGETLRLNFTFDFGSNVDETKFTTKMFTYSDFNVGPFIDAVPGNGFTALNGLGKADKTSDVDLNKTISNTYKTTTTAGQVEWCVLYPWDGTKHRILIDSRQFGTGSPAHDLVNTIQLFDLYTGNMSFNADLGSGSAYWVEYYIYTNFTSKITSSTFSQYIRDAGGWYALRADFTFSQNQNFKNHAILFGEYNTTQLQSLLNQVVTVSDVYLAFKEFSDKGIMGNESKYFQSGVQFHNADVDTNGVFDERDCYILLQHLQGISSLWGSGVSLSKMMKIIPTSTYDAMKKNNWMLYGNTSFIGSKYPVTIVDKVLNSYSLNVTWKGDVNLSHSAIPDGITTITNSSINSQKLTTMSVNSISNTNNEVTAEIMLEKVGDEIVATISLDPAGKEIGATQFALYYDNTALEFNKVSFNNTTLTNFAKNDGSMVNLGSLNTNGGAISNITYKVTFKPKTTITNLLGLISIYNLETVGVNLNKLIIKII